MTNFTAIAKLLSLLRMNGEGGQIGGLSIESLLLVAESPRTLEELTHLTGAHNGSVSRAIRSITPVWNAEKGVIHMPHLHLLVRKKRKPPLTGHEYRLARGGKQLLQEAGLMN